MATKKKQSPQHRQLKQLRATVLKLRGELAKEARRRKTHVSLATRSEKARAMLAEQVGALREKGRTLAQQLKQALGSAEKRQKARDEAMERIAELRKELGRKTEELRRKSGELAQLAKQSAERAYEIIQEGPETRGGPEAGASVGQGEVPASPPEKAGGT
jgi:ABC-type transporter Mla subunit MlaD